MAKRKLAILFLVLLIAIPIVNAARHVMARSIWDGEHHINIAIENDDVEVWSIEPKTKSIAKITIPKNLYLTVSPYGTYRAGALGKLSLVEKKDGSLMAAAIAESLAIPIDAVVVRKTEGEEKVDLSSFYGLGGIGKILRSKPDIVTNLSAFDLLRLWFFSFQLNSQAIEQVNVGDWVFVTKIVLPDQTEGLIVDSERFAKLASAHITDKQIKEENLTIEVINGTNEAGRANRMALMLGNIGGNVINTDKGVETDRTRVFAKSASYTATKIGKIVGGDISIGPVKESRADIVVILGGQGQ